MSKAKRKKRFNLNIDSYVEIVLLVLFPCVLSYLLLNLLTSFYELPWFTEIHIDKFLISLLSILALYVLTDRLIKSNIIRFLVKMMVIMSFVPISIVFSFSEYSYSMFFIFFLEIMITIITVLLITLKKDKTYNLKKSIKSKIENINLKNKVNISKIICTLFLIITVIVIFVCALYNGIPSFTALKLKDVYEVRGKFYLPKMLSYLYDFDVKFIIPFFIILNIDRKKYFRLALSIIALLLFFLWKGDKIVLFSIPLLLGTYFIFKFAKKIKPDKFIIGIILLVAILSIVFSNFGNYTMLSLIIRRTLLVPANLKFVHIDFFEKNPKIGIIGTIFNAFLKLENPYEDSDFTKLIGKLYFNSPNTHANTGFLAEGFARWGYVGIIILPIILGMVLCIIHYGAKKNSLAFTAGISVLPIYTLNDGYLLPSLTFGAIALLMIICIFFKVEDLNKGREIPDEYKDVTG